MLTIMLQLTIGAVDLAVAFLFMFGLWRMSSPVTAPSGMTFAGCGMVAAVLGSFLYVFTVGAAAKPHLAVNIGLAVAALSIGGGVAWWSGKKVALTAMPQLVALFNGMGGGAAGSIAAVELFGNKAQRITQLVVALIGALIGAVSLSGSLIAWAKLDGVLMEYDLYVTKKDGCVTDLVYVAPPQGFAAGVPDFERFATGLRARWAAPIGTMASTP